MLCATFNVNNIFHVQLTTIMLCYNLTHVSEETNAIISHVQYISIHKVPIINGGYICSYRHKH